MVVVINKKDLCSNVAKVLHASNVWSVAWVTLGAREGVNIQVVAGAFFTRHRLHTPNRIVKVGGLYGLLFFFALLARALLLASFFL
jgi:hypothetical protein